MLTRIDKSLLALAQATVETTQIRPARWVVYCAHLMLIGTAGEAAIRMQADVEPWLLTSGLLSGLTCAGATWMIGRSDAAVAAYGSLLDGWRRYVLLAVAVVALMDVAQTTGVVHWVLSNLVILCIAASDYFAACKPPTPRPPKAKTATKALPQGAPT